MRVTKSPTLRGAALIVLLFVVVASFLWVGVFVETQSDPTEPSAWLDLGEPCDDGPTDVIGLEYCPELEPMIPTLIEIKKNLLRLGLDAAADGGGKYPMMLVNVLVQETADLLFSSNIEPANDPATGDGSNVHVDGWIQENREGSVPENSFLKRLDNFYVEHLHRTRPVVVFVKGNDMCTFWDELGGNAEDGEREPTSAEDPTLDHDVDVDMDVSEDSKDFDHVKVAASAVADGKTPLVLMTLGWDANGSPFFSRWSECSDMVLQMPQVVRWFVSHNRYYSPNPKIQFVPIGLGGAYPRNKLSTVEFLSFSAEKLRRLESCASGEMMEMLFMCNNNSSNTPRAAINNALTDEDYDRNAPRVVPINHYPMGSAETAEASTNGIFAISPPGTRPDCFRHYEFLMAGNIVYVPDDPSLRVILSELPVVFVDGIDDGWGNITCEAMAGHARYVAERLQKGLRQGATPAFNYAKLMTTYWTRFVRDIVWQAAAEIRQAHDEYHLPTTSTSLQDPADFPAEMAVGSP